MIVALVINIIVVALAFHLRPMIRKRSLFFGVTVDDSFSGSAEARAITRAYWLTIWTGALASIALVAVLARPRSPFTLMLMSFIQVVVGLFASAMASRKTRPFASRDVASQRSAELVESSPNSGVLVAAILIPFAGPIAAAWHLWNRFDLLPQRYPIHWNAAGQADRFAEKSITAVFLPPMIMAGVLLLTAVLALGIQFGSRRGTSGERAGWSARHRNLNLLMLVSIMWIISGMVSAMSFGAVLPPGAMKLITLGSTALLLGAVAAFGIPLFRMSMEATGGTDATPDECWHWGTFYRNEADPALIVEKRDGPGFTLNFGHPLSWVIFALIVVITVVPIVLSMRL